MRGKNNIANGRNTPPEAFPDVLQDAVYSDDYVMQQNEQNMIAHLLTKARIWKDQMDKVRKKFIEKGGKMETISSDSAMCLQLKESSIYASGKKIKVKYTKADGESVHRLLNAALKAYIQEYRIESAISNLERAAELMLSLHLVRGLAEKGDLAAGVPATLDEILRGHIVWDDNDAQV